MKSSKRRALKSLLCDAQNNECYICKEVPADDEITLDHVRPWPRSKRGGNIRTNMTMGNCLIACLACNREKANRPPTEAELEYLAKINEKLRYDPDVGFYAITTYQRIKHMLGKKELRAVLDRYGKALVIQAVEFYCMTIDVDFIESYQCYREMRNQSQEDSVIAPS